MNVPYFASYLSALILFLVVDVIWIKAVMLPIFKTHVGHLLLEQPRLALAATFYLAYVAGVIYFAVMPAAAAQSWRIAAMNGALLGLLAYGTYEVTNMSTLRDWAWSMFFTDIAWGTFLTAITALAGYAGWRYSAG